MRKKKNTTETSQVEENQNEQEDVDQESTMSRKRPERKKVYERTREAHIPKYIKDIFEADNYSIRLIRWSVMGDVDYRNLNRRLEEGYEFVNKSELPEDFLRRLRIRDTSVTKGMLTNGGDLCYMKVDKDLQKSRREYYHNEAQAELDAVDMNVLEKKGLRNTGTKSKVMLREPSFGD